MGRDRKEKAKYYKALEHAIQGPGIFATCTRGRERKAEQELYDLLNDAADRLYPEKPPIEEDAEDAGADDMDIEAAIAQEVSDMKTAKKRGKHRFLARKTNIECVLFISCNKPYDPLRMVQLIVQDLLNGKAPRSRWVQRLSPVAMTCSASSITSIESMARQILAPTFTDCPSGSTYKIEHSIRLADHMPKSILLPAIGAVVQYLVRSTDDQRTIRADLANGHHVIIVELFKNVCGMSVVDGDLYRQTKRFNIDALAKELIKAKAQEPAASESNEPAAQEIDQD